MSYPPQGRLPQELVDLIIGELHHYPTLSRCSLVHSSWLYTTRKFLFNFLSVIADDEGKYNTFIDFIQVAPPSISLSVRNLELCGPIDSGWKEDDIPDVAAYVTNGILLSILTRLPKLETLRLDCVYFTAISDDDDLSIRKQQVPFHAPGLFRLKSLELECIGDLDLYHRHNVSEINETETCILDIVNILILFDEIGCLNVTKCGLLEPFPGDSSELSTQLLQEWVPVPHTLRVHSLKVTTDYGIDIAPFIPVLARMLLPNTLQNVEFDVWGLEELPSFAELLSNGDIRSVSLSLQCPRHPVITRIPLSSLRSFGLGLSACGSLERASFMAAKMDNMLFPIASQIHTTLTLVSFLPRTSSLKEIELTFDVHGKQCMGSLLPILLASEAHWVATDRTLALEFSGLKALSIKFVDNVHKDTDMRWDSVYRSDHERPLDLANQDGYTQQELVELAYSFFSSTVRGDPANPSARGNPSHVLFYQFGHFFGERMAHLRGTNRLSILYEPGDLYF
ncbi:unnamed protein product [Somion occarium]|uniref:F-box domain-containing protein n=1 Tax=Somion occarium TaxID=3059160 RepID=A0ABP1DNH3_9APHY